MRSSILRGALALLSVTAITGCSGSTWSPTWWNPFHTTPSTTTSNTSVRRRRPGLRRWPHRRYGSGTTANPYSPYRAALHPVTALRRVPTEIAAMARLLQIRIHLQQSGRIQRDEQHLPGQLQRHGTRFVLGHTRRHGGQSVWQLCQSRSVIPGPSTGSQYPVLAANPYARHRRLPGTYPTTSTPYGASTPAATPAGLRPARATVARCLAAQRRATAASTTPGYGSGATTPSYGSGATTPSYGSGATIPGYGAGATTPSYGSGATTPSYGCRSRTTPGYGSARRRRAAISPREVVPALCRLRVRPVRIAIRPGRLRPPEAMTVTATSMVRPPWDQPPRPRRPTRWPTRAVRLAAVRQAACPRPAILIRPARVRCIAPATSTPVPNATSPYPSSGAAPAASDSGEPAYRPGRLKTSGDLSAEHQQLVAVVAGQQFQRFGSRSRRLRGTLRRPQLIGQAKSVQRRSAAASKSPRVAFVRFLNRSGLLDSERSRV